MKGFVTDPRGEYSRILKALLGNSTGAYDAQIYKFTSDFTPVTHMAFSKAQTADFYDGLWTPLSDLFNRIVTEHQSSPRISVLVSDLVQSERLRDHTDLMRAIRQLTRTRQEVALYAFRSIFKGRYETETLPKKVYDLNIDRPFYVLIIAPDPKSLDQFRREVFKGITEQRAFYPTHAPGSVIAAKYAPREPDKRTWNRHQEIQLDDAPFGVKRILAHFRDRDARRVEVS